MKIKNLKLKIWIVGLVLLACTFPKETRAQGISLGINPPIITIEANPPANISTPITLANKSDQTITLLLQFRPFTAATSADGKLRYLPQGSTSAPFFRNVQLLENERVITSLILSPKQKKTVSLHLDISKDEPAKDYYFSIVFLGKSQSQENADEKVSNQTTIKGGIATNVLVSIGPKEKISGILEDFSAPFFLNLGPVPFTVRLKNTSNHVISSNGEVLIKNMFGQTVGKVPLLPVHILSQTSRYVPDSRQSFLESNNERIPAIIWDERFLLGFYKAQVNLELSEKGPTITREIVFFAFPVVLFGGFVILASVLLFILARVRSRLS